MYIVYECIQFKLNSLKNLLKVLTYNYHTLFLYILRLQLLEQFTIIRNIPKRLNRNVKIIYQNCLRQKI